MSRNRSSSAALGRGLLCLSTIVLFAGISSALEKDPAISETIHRPHLLVLQDEDERVVLVPELLIAPGYILNINRAQDDWYEGSRISFLEAKGGFSARFLNVVKLSVMAELVSGGASLKDAYLELDPWSSKAAFRIGWFKIPFSRQYDVGASRRQFVLGARSGQLAASRRSLGTQLTSQVKGIVKTQLALMARDIDGVGFQFDSGFVASGRFWFDVVGNGAGSGETDLAGSPGPGMSTGLAVLYERAADELHWHGTQWAEPFDENRLALGPQLAFKYRRVSLQMEFFYRHTWVAAETPGRISRGEPTVNSIGGYAQLGVFLISRRLELAGRFDAHDEDLDVAGWYLNPAGALTWFVLGHHLKAQVLYRANLKADDPFIEGAPTHTPTTHSVVCAIVVGL